MSLFCRTSLVHLALALGKSSRKVVALVLKAMLAKPQILVGQDGPVLRAGTAEALSLHSRDRCRLRLRVNVVDLLAVAFFYYTTAEFQARR